MYYLDKYGDKWLRYSEYDGFVQRVKDGNIGGWFDGKGLVAV